jgi:hypothetical protein
MPIARTENGVFAGSRNVSGNSRAAPAEECLQTATDYRRENRRDAGDRAHQRQFAPGARPGIEIAHHSARQHDGARAAEGLQKAQADQRIDRSRNGAADRGEHVNDQRRQQHRPAAEPVGDRPVEDLPDGKAEQIARDRQLHLQCWHLQHAADVGQRRQIHVHRQRPERGQKRQQQSEAERAGAKHVRSI